MRISDWSSDVCSSDLTRNILSRENLLKTKKGVRVINCARGGLVDEQALKDLLDSGHVDGAALAVFVEEPAKQSPLFGTRNRTAARRVGKACVSTCKSRGSP